MEAPEFELMQTFVLGPVGLQVEAAPDEGNMARGMELVIPGMSWANDIKLFLPMQSSESEDSVGYRRIDQELRSSMYMDRDSVRITYNFDEDFYVRHRDLISDPARFAVVAMIYSSSPVENSSARSKSEGAMQRG